VSPPRVPFLDLRAQYARLREELRTAVDRVFERQAFVLGEEVEALEGELAAYCEARRAIGCASGSDALLLALMAVGVGPGDEVVCPAFTFFATAGAVARLGARPVFADVDPATLCLDPDAARAAAARCRRLRAIVPVHLYGRAANLDALLALASELGVPVVEDAAQAIGARDASGRRVGARGRVACFSFYPTKNLGGAGDGGLLTTDDEALADRFARLRVHGAVQPYLHEEIGVNSRLDALQAAVLRVKLRHLEAWNAAGELPLRVPREPAPPAVCVWHQYVVRVPAPRRDAVRAHLASCGVATEVYYPRGLHQQPCFAGLGPVHLPETEAAARENIALPIHPELADAQREHVVASLLEALEA
jgi:dTDP-4-amino-4,6-dideoxygalactose transaminase